MAKAKRKKGKSKISAILLVIVIIIAGIVTYFQSNTPEEDESSVTTTNWAEALASAGLLPNGTTQSDSSNGLCVDFVDVGQGDCTFISCEGKNMLIDCGEAESYQTVKSYLKNKGVNKLDIVVATHPHSDHIGGMYMLIEDFEIGTFIMPKIPKSITPTTKTYQKMISALSEKSITPDYAQTGKNYYLSDSEIKILGPVKNYDDLNNMSVVLMLEYGKSKFLFTGDAESEAEKDIISNSDDLKCDVLKLGHHGSKTSSSDEFLKAASPKTVVISVGENNEYSHPHSQTMKKLYKLDVTIFRTDKDSTVKMRIPSQSSEIIYPN